MTRYIVTTELKTNWFKRLLRYFYLIEPREEFSIALKTDLLQIDEIVCSGTKGILVKIVGKQIVK
jgi:hypothetical protein